jgi:dynein heavy chain
MRPRHWQQVMQITGKQLNLAEDVFKLQHLLDANILGVSEAGAHTRPLFTST